MRIKKVLKYNKYYNNVCLSEECELYDNNDNNAEINTNNSRIKRKLHNSNAGIGVIVIILILVILIALVLIFREKITSIVNNALQTIETDSGTIIGTENDK